MDEKYRNLNIYGITTLQIKLSLCLQVCSSDELAETNDSELQGDKIRQWNIFATLIYLPYCKSKKKLSYV